MKISGCDQCNPTMLQGIFCHETGCPNKNKKYNSESESWESVYTCAECGSEYSDSDSAGQCCQPEDIELTESEIIYNELKNQFNRNRLGIITSPGKFEGETLATPYFYNCMLNDGESGVMEIEDSEYELFNIDKRYKYVLTYESTNGFASVAYFETLQAAEDSPLNSDNDIDDSEDETES